MIDFFDSVLAIFFKREGRNGFGVSSFSLIHGGNRCVKIYLVDTAR